MAGATSAPVPPAPYGLLSNNRRLAGNFYRKYHTFEARSDLTTQKDAS